MPRKRDGASAFAHEVAEARPRRGAEDFADQRLPEAEREHLIQLRYLRKVTEGEGGGGGVDGGRSRAPCSGDVQPGQTENTAAVYTDSKL